MKHFWVVISIIFTTNIFALDPQNVLVIYNNNISDSQQIANRYSELYPNVRLLGINSPSSTEISATTYLNTIRPQILPYLTNSTDVIVTTKYLPLRIDAGTNSNYSIWRRYSSLESELTRIDSIDTIEKMGNQSLISNGNVANPYYLSNNGFSYLGYGIRLSSRLDGYSIGDIFNSLDRSCNAVINKPDQRFLLDDDWGFVGDQMEKTFINLVGHGQSVEYNGVRTLVMENEKNIVGYVSHGTNSGGGSDYISNFEFSLSDGAIFHSYESYNCWSFTLGEGTRGQGQVGQWLSIGGTAGVGHVEEPYVGDLYVTNEDIMWDRLLSGYSFVESAWMSTGELSYVNTMIGNPLMTFNEWDGTNCMSVPECSSLWILVVLCLFRRYRISNKKII